MIEFTIKTLDSNNHSFSVDDETTVQQLKEKVKEQMGIEPNLQRLIFCGRVLQDDAKLSQYDINGKVVHLVQRAPPGPDSRNQRIGIGLGGSSGGGGGGSSGGHGSGRGRGRFLSNTAVTLSPTAGRLDALRRLINEIKACMNYLRAQVGFESNNQDDGDDDDGETSTDNPPTRFHPQRRNNRATRALRVRLSQPRQLAQLIEEIDNLQDEFAPHRADFVRILRSANDPELQDYTEEQRRQSQILADLVSDIMHSFSHAYHIISDISLTIGQRHVRLNSDLAVTRHLIPMQAQVNVIQTSRRPNQQNNSSTAPSESANTGNQSSAQPTNTTPTFATTSAPTAATTAAPTGAPTAAPTAVPTSTPAAAPTTAPNAASTPMPTGPPDANGTHHATLADLENLLRTLSQGTLGGIEVVMSMEEIPPGAPVGNLGTMLSPTNSTPSQPPPVLQHADGVIVTPMALTGAPSGDLMQHIMASLLRQSLTPGTEALAGGFHTPSNVNPPNPTPAQDLNNPDRARSHIYPWRRPTISTTQAQQQHALVLSNLVYDRFLQCDSNHARLRLQRRRELHVRQLEQRERFRTERLTVRNIEMLRHHIPAMTPRHIFLIVQLLNSEPSPVGYFNAAMLTISRQQYLSEALNPTGNESPMMPNEFQAVRQILRDAIYSLVTQSSFPPSDIRQAVPNAFQGIVDILIEEHESFIEGMAQMTPLREEIDAVESIRALLRSRLPAIIACIMSDAENELSVSRFYSLFFRVYAELCALVYHMCIDPESGLRHIYTVFLDEMIFYFPEPMQSTMRLLGIENFNTLMRDISPYEETAMQFVRRTDGTMPDGSSDTEVSVTMAQEDVEYDPIASSTPAVAGENASATAMEAESPDADAPIHVDQATSTEDHENDADDNSPSGSPHVYAGARPNRGQSSASRANASVSTVCPVHGTRTDAAVLPPSAILQHFGEQWMPVFTRDQQIQRAQVQEPYSDGYLSGMPARKRRCIRQSRSSTTLDGFMDENVRDAANDAAIRAAFRQRLRGMVRSRADASEDYEPVRYAAAANFITGDNRPKNDRPDSNDKEAGI